MLGREGVVIQIFGTDSGTEPLLELASCIWLKHECLVCPEGGCPGCPPPPPAPYRALCVLGLSSDMKPRKCLKPILLLLTPYLPSPALGPPEALSHVVPSAAGPSSQLVPAPSTPLLTTSCSLLPRVSPFLLILPPPPGSLQDFLYLFSHLPA